MKILLSIKKNVVVYCVLAFFIEVVGLFISEYFHMNSALGILVNAILLASVLFIFSYFYIIQPVKKTAQKYFLMSNKMQASLKKTLGALICIVEKRDPYTAGHQYRVAFLAHLIARKMKLNDELCLQIYRGAIVHDIGKINVPTEILSKPGALTEPEFEMIKCHPKIGHEIVSQFEFSSVAEDIVLNHHERLDGSGYPNGLKGEAISLAVKIVSVADVYEAMSSRRPYRDSNLKENAVEHLQAGSGKMYDQTVVEVCVNIVSDPNFMFPKTENLQVLF